MRTTLKHKNKTKDAVVEEKKAVHTTRETHVFTGDSAES